MTSGVALYWLPLGADGNPVVRWSGQAYEAIDARRDHRVRRPLFHSALRVRLDDTSYVVEVAPAWGAPRCDHGVVGWGAVGMKLLGRSRFFTYEVRRWRGGEIPDVDRAVESPVDLDATNWQARALLALVPVCPTPVWGRDDLDAGDMWNSNSVIAWLVTRAGLDGEGQAPPRHGRAPGWDAGIRVATRQGRHDGLGRPGTKVPVGRPVAGVELTSRTPRGDRDESEKKVLQEGEPSAAAW